MNDYPLQLHEIAAWFEAAGKLIGPTGIVLVKIEKQQENVPSAYADFDSPMAFGRISGMVNGLFDFDVLSATDGGQLFYRHVDTPIIPSQALSTALGDFAEAMVGRSDAHVVNG